MDLWKIVWVKPLLKSTQYPRKKFNVSILCDIPFSVLFTTTTITSTVIDNQVEEPREQSTHEKRERENKDFLAFNKDFETLNAQVLMFLC